MYYETFREMGVSIIPEIVYYRERTHTITWAHPMYTIDKYTVISDHNNKLCEVFILDAWHPNAGDPTSSEIKTAPPHKQNFCVPEWVVGQDMNEMIFENLEYYVLRRWWLDDPHHYPSYGKHFITNPTMENIYTWRRR